MTLASIGIRLCAVVLVGAALGCDGGEDKSDAGAHDAGAHGRICEGSYWADMLPELADCTVIGGDVTLTGNNLIGIDLPVLTRVGGTLSVWGNPALTRVAFPELTRVGGYLHVSYNDVLAELELPALESVNDRALQTNADLLIGTNRMLPTCTAQAIGNQLLDAGFDGSVEISDNLGTCPP